MEKRLKRPFHRYAVTLTGEIISYNKGKRKQIKTPLNRYGYCKVTLCVTLKGKRLLKYTTVHILVAHAFLLPKPRWATQVNHIDGNKTNNLLENLEWSTRKLNGAHASANGLYRTGIRHPKTFLSEDMIRYIKYESVKEGISTCALARKFNLWKGTVWRIRTGQTWKHI